MNFEYYLRFSFSVTSDLQSAIKRLEDRIKNIEVSDTKKSGATAPAAPKPEAVRLEYSL